MGKLVPMEDYWVFNWKEIGHGSVPFTNARFHTCPFLSPNGSLSFSAFLLYSAKLDPRPSALLIRTRTIPHSSPPRKASKPSSPTPKTSLLAGKTSKLKWIVDCNFDRHFPLIQSPSSQIRYQNSSLVEYFSVAPHLPHLKIVSENEFLTFLNWSIPSIWVTIKSVLRCFKAWDHDSL